MKLFDKFDLNPLVFLTKLGKTHSDEKRYHSLTLRAKVKVIAKIKRQCPREQQTCRPPTDLSLIICYKRPTDNHRKRSTKVKSDQVNFNHCSTVSGK